MMFKKVLLPSLYLLMSAIGLKGQNDAPADAYIRIADDFKKKAQPDSAVMY